VQGRNILLFVDMCGAYQQDNMISKEEKLVYYAPKLQV
jgi:hypothetical protein